jgi:1-hydroxycarotenoid 3,4-desaturase
MGRSVKTVVVIGAGMAGLAAAIDLAVRGVRVVVMERDAAPGGKMREVEVAGRRIDAGPTVLTLRHVFEELFDHAGARLEDYIALRPSPVLARHAWSASEQLDLFADVSASEAAIGQFAGPDEARRFAAFCGEAARIYRTLERPFLRAQRPSVLRLTRAVGWRHLPDLWRIRPFTTLWRALGSHFHDPRLRQLFGRYATYCGSSPFESPATLMLVAHVEQQGVWLVEGGMHRLARGLERLALARGVEFRYGSQVTDLVSTAGRVSGVRTADGSHVPVDAVIFNGDLNALAAGRLGETGSHAVLAAETGTRSLSAITWSMVARTEGFPLERHNVFFSRDYAREFEALRNRMLPSDPTVYVCAQDRPQTEAGATAVDKRERLLCLVNAPATTDSGAPSERDLAACEKGAFAALERCGLRVESANDETHRTAPQDFDRLFPGSRGALYGSASHGWRSSFARPGSRSRLPGLYLAGGGVHPGPGVPMTALSGRLAAAAVLAAH